MYTNFLTTFRHLPDQLFEVCNGYITSVISKGYLKMLDPVVYPFKGVVNQKHIYHVKNILYIFAKNKSALPCE